MAKKNSGLGKTFFSIKRARAILTPEDRRKLGFMTAFQVFIGLFDVYGIAMIGAIGALAVQIIEGKPAGRKVSLVLRILHIQHYSLQTDVAILGAIAGAVLLAKSAISIFVQRKIFRFLSYRGASLTGELLKKILSQDLVEIQKVPSQQLLSTVTGSVKDLLLGLLGTFSSLLADVSLLVLIILSLLVYDFMTAIFLALLFGLLVFALHKLLSERARVIGVEVVSRTIKNDSRILEVIQSYREAVVRNRRGYYAKEVTSFQTELAGYQAEAQFLPFISKYVLESFTIIASLGLASIAFVSKNGVNGFASLGIFYAAATRISSAALRVQQEMLQLKQTEGSANLTLDMVEKLHNIREVEESSDDFDFAHINFLGDVTIKDLSFSYSSDSNFALRDINLNIKHGESVAFVGPSGAGKTTLIDLILGVLKPNTGQILVSEISPEEASKKWSGAISYVPQNVVISNSTIRKNVGLGYPDRIAADNHVKEALKTAQLLAQVEDMKNGLDAAVGEFGSSLSGGQRQRLGIARALFTNPKLLVLDEATSALDAQTEADLGEAIMNMHGKVTVLIVAHRLSTVRAADKVVYMDKGKVLAVGKFDEVRKQIPDFDRQADLMGME